MHQYTELLFRYMMYLVIFIGTYFIIYPFIKPLFQRSKANYRFRQLQREKKYKRNRFFLEIERLLSNTLNVTSTYAVTTFLVISFSIFVATFFFLFSSGLAWFRSVSMAIIIGGLPYIVLRLRLHSIRVEASYEGDILVTELVNQYKINHFNIIEAIDQTVPNLKQAKFTKRALVRLSMKIKQYQTKEELEDIIQGFQYGIGTQWAMLLANNIYLAVAYGDNVTASMNDILNELQILKKMNEQSKQYNNEAFMMIKYVAPLAYAASVWAMFVFFDFNLQKYIDFQFLDPLGFKIFTWMLGMAIISYVLYFFVKKPKNDF